MTILCWLGKIEGVYINQPADFRLLRGAQEILTRNGHDRDNTLAGVPSCIQFAAGIHIADRRGSQAKNYEVGSCDAFLNGLPPNIASLDLFPVEPNMQTRVG